VLFNKVYLKILHGEQTTSIINPIPTFGKFILNYEIKENNIK